MKTPVFVSFCLFIVGVLLAMHAVFEDSMDPIDQLRDQLARVEKKRQTAELSAMLAAYQLQDYQQHVATLVPELLKGKSEPQAYPLRQLASVASGPTGMISIERASGLFEEAKEAFRKKDYEESNLLLERLITRFPSSVHVVEAHFLLSEGQFQLKDYQSSISTIERMIDLYPENDLTGFALLRLGKIFEAQDRLEDAADIYRAILANFAHAPLVKQARLNLEAVDL